MEIIAPVHWKCIDFISDLHLQADDTATFQGWSQYMRTSPADALFILGDLFEVWVGDDALLATQGFEACCASVLREAAARMELFVMHGNRDFLMGETCMQSMHARLLPDPSVLVYQGLRLALSHGDAWCLDDAPYQAFRTEVRSAAWQNGFLAQPLSERVQIARGIRAQSTARKQGASAYTDVRTSAVIGCMQSLGCSQMVHGHTHAPALHLHAHGLQRWVLSDWELAGATPRADVLRLRLDADQKPQIRRLSPVAASQPMA